VPPPPAPETRSAEQAAEPLLLAPHRQEQQMPMPMPRKRQRRKKRRKKRR
jgi:hypothetical protein